MWWTSPNLDRTVRDRDGREWHFRVWHDHVDGIYTQRIYFWDASREIAGCAEFVHDQSLDVSRLNQRMRKIIFDANYREKFLCELQFPIERHYS